MSWALECGSRAGVGEDSMVGVMGTRHGEVGDLAELLTRLHDEYQCVPPPEAQRALPVMQSYNDAVSLWSQDMIGAPPWRVGTEQQRWDGHLDLTTSDPYTGMSVLRNLVGATTYDELHHREDTFVGYRGATLHANGAPATYDPAGLQSIHRHLFQDVYEWAGEVRTVSIAKGRAFVAPEQIESSFAQIAEVIRDTDQLRTVPDRYPESLARVYYVVNTIHPFREGNAGPSAQQPRLTTVCANRAAPGAAPGPYGANRPLGASGTAPLSVKP